MGNVLQGLLVVSGEAFTLLKRDRVFLPALAFGVAVVFLANLASDWSVAEFYKILFDIGYFGFQMVGLAGAVFWGIKSISDSRHQGALEVQLAAPVGRTTWLVGKYLGLALALVLLWLLLLAIWWAVMYANAFGHMTGPQIATFVFMLIGWLVVAAVATLFASCTGQAVAMFATVAAILVGLASSLVASTLSRESSAASRSLVQGVARIWDLQQFNLVNRATEGSFPEAAELMNRAAYGGLLILLLISLACLVFARRDVNP